ncbi:tapasin-like isoform X2 [Rhinoraja longicauda]
MTLKHRYGKFTTICFMRELKVPDHVETEQGETPTDDETTPIGNTDTLIIQVNYIIHTRTPLVRSKMKQDLVLDCGFKIDHSADFYIDWRYQHRSVRRKLFIYNGKNRQTEQIEKGVEAFMDQIGEGNASIRIRNVDINSEGSYTCLVYVPPLFGTHTINLEIREPPTVSLSPSSLSVREGDEQKLACNVARYYPLDVMVRWQRQRQQGEEHLVPDYLSNSVSSSHLANKDGTFSVTSYHRFTASLSDNGAAFVCQVDHVSLEKPIKRYVYVRVQARPQMIFYTLIVILLLFFCAIAIILLIHLNKVMDKHKKKPY